MGGQFGRLECFDRGLSAAFEAVCYTAPARATRRDGEILPDDLVQRAVSAGSGSSLAWSSTERAFLSYLLTSIRHRIVDEVEKEKASAGLRSGR